MKRRFFTLFAVLVLAGCCLVGIRMARPAAPAALPEASPSPSAQAGPTLALFGDSTDPLCEPLFAQLTDWASARGWSLITYDCRGNPTSQTGQLEDLVRNEHADCAVLCLPRAAGNEAHSQQQRLAILAKARIPTLTVDSGAYQPAGGRVVCRICPAQDEPYATAAGFFGAGRILLLADLPDDPWVEQAQAVLEARGLDVLGYGACWSNREYAQDYLTAALELYGPVDGVLCASLPGALGARDALGDDAAAKVLCLAQGPAVEDALALGQLDGALTADQSSLFSALQAALPGLPERTAPELCPIRVKLLTP